MALVFIAFQNNNKKKILRYQAAAGVIFAFHFIFLGAYTGGGMNALEAARNLSFCREEKMRCKTFWVMLYIVLFTLLGILTWQNSYSFLPIIAMNLSTVAFAFKNPKHIRFCFLPVAGSWLAYNIISFSIAGILTEVFDLISLFTAIRRFDISKRQQE